MSKKMKTLVITKSKWYRGKGSDDSALYREHDGKQCCLGFLARARGAKIKDIEDAEMPSSTINLSFWPKELVVDSPLCKMDTDLCSQMATVNDATDISDKERIKKLRPLFAKIDYKLVFKE